MKPYGSNFGAGPQLTPDGLYQHGIFCSGGPYDPRTPGNTCSCHSCDLWYNKIAIAREGADAKRTLWVAACPGCHDRTEFPYTSEAIPREVFCLKCSLWAKVEEISWEGLDLAKLLPVKERR